MSTGSRASRPAGARRAARRSRSPRCAARSPTGRRCWRASTRRSPTTDRAAADRQRRGQRGGRLPRMARDDNFTFLGMREYDYRRRRDARRAPARAASPASASSRDPAAPRAPARRRGGHDDAGDPRIPDAAGAADRHQGQPEIARPPPRHHRLHRRQALRRERRARRRTAHRRPVHLDRLYALGPRPSPISAARSQHVIARAGFDPGEPFRQGADQRAGDLSARRAVPDRRGHALRLRASPILALDERPRVRVLARRDQFDRFVSVIVFVPRDRYDSDIRERIGDYLADGLRRAGLGLLSGLPGRRAGPRPFHHRPLRRQDARSEPGDARGRGRGDHRAPGATGSRRPSADAFDADARRPPRTRYGARLSAGLSRRLRAGGRGRRHRQLRGPDGGAPDRRRIPHHRGRRAATSA